ncbi:protein YbgS [Acerihabitans sp. TG2]|uniref:protein YbgS n=1 Tax=Acerihabitans sp. TG2 TaxID=3096008 RepID=UPI002B23D67A|nr:protein YbgS [Acerihabitans sp. TG2]MEA9390524.1 protein YbgS [Acerihabitans sp. TG2]
MQTYTNKTLAMLVFTAITTLGSGAALAATTSSTTGDGMENQTNYPGSNANSAPDGVSNKDINTGKTGKSKLSAAEIHKNTMCKDGRCPNTNAKVQTGKGMPTKAQKTDGTTQ